MPGSWQHNSQDEAVQLSWLQHRVLPGGSQKVTPSCGRSHSDLVKPLIWKCLSNHNRTTTEATVAAEVGCYPRIPMHVLLRRTMSGTDLCICACHSLQAANRVIPSQSIKMCVDQLGFCQCMSTQCTNFLLVPSLIIILAGLEGIIECPCKPSPKQAIVLGLHHVDDLQWGLLRTLNSVTNDWICWSRILVLHLILAGNNYSQD